MKWNKNEDAGMKITVLRSHTVDDQKELSISIFWFSYGAWINYFTAKFKTTNALFALRNEEKKSWKNK